MKLGTIRYYKKKADNLCSLIIRKRGRCENCSRSEGVQLHCAHIVGRNNHTLRFDFINMLCLCAGCHRWAHDNPDEFTDFWRKKWPSRKVYIDANRNKITKRTALDYKELVDGLKEEVKKHE